MRTLLGAALLLSLPALASPLTSASLLPPTLLSQAEPPADDEEEDDEEEGEEEEETSTLPGGASDASPSTLPGVAPTPGAQPTGDAPREHELVSGAPLYNPRVAVHIVERKLFSDKSKHEIALFPTVAQVNGKFTQHFGTALSYTYHLHENFGFQLTPQFNWYNTESAFNQELINKVREEAQAATSLLLNWGALAGVEVVPVYGKFAWYDSNLLQYSVVINGAAGYGSTRHQLKPENEAGPASFGDTGNRFLGSVGGGFRVQFGDRFAVRLEVRDLIYTARVSEVNGCDVEDLQQMDRALREGRNPVDATVKTGCDKETFRRGEGVDDRSRDVPLAYSLVREPTSDVLNLVSFYAGASFIF